MVGQEDKYTTTKKILNWERFQWHKDATKEIDPIFMKKSVIEIIKLLYH